MVSKTACSVTLLNEVSGHLRNELEAVLHVLGLAIAILLVFLPKSNNNSGCGLTAASTATRGGELSDSCVFVLVSEHELLATHADTSFGGSSVSISGTHGSGSLVARHILSGSVHLLERMIVGGEAREGTSQGPLGTVVAINGSTRAHSCDRPVISIVIESVQNLIGVSLPSVSHRIFLI